MMASADWTRVTNAFFKYANDGEESHIAEFTISEIRHAIILFSNSVDKNSPCYKAMELRLAHLEEEERFVRDTRQRWQDRSVGFIGAALLAVLIEVTRRLLGG